MTPFQGWYVFDASITMGFAASLVYDALSGLVGNYGIGLVEIIRALF